MTKVSHDLRNILTTDRIETGQDQIDQRMAPKLVQSIARAVSLAKVAHDVVESERLATTEQAVDLIRQVPARFMLLADAERMFNILSNLVRNAC